MLFASDILLLSKALNQLEYNVEKEAVIATYIDEVTIRWKINHSSQLGSRVWQVVPG